LDESEPDRIVIDDFDDEDVLPLYCQDVTLFKQDGLRGSMVELSMGINDPAMFGKL
jgi:hypothetical protein